MSSDIVVSDINPGLINDGHPALLFLGGIAMLLTDVALLPSYIYNTAGSALKRVSEAIGYNMTCSSQEPVAKQLPEPCGDTQDFTGQPPVTLRRVFGPGHYLAGK